MERPVIAGESDAEKVESEMEMQGLCRRRTEVDGKVWKVAVL